MPDQHSIKVARDTYEWMVDTGRFSHEAERRINDMSLPLFLKWSAEKWSAEGALQYMQGMKDAMNTIIWEGEKWTTEN